MADSSLQVDQGRLCAACSKFLQNLDGPSDLYSSRIHHESSSGFRKSVEHGCYICCAMLSSVPSSEVAKLDDYSGEKFSEVLYACDMRTECRTFFTKNLSISPENEHLLFFNLLPASNFDHYEREHRAFRRVSSTSSSETLAIANKWLRDCSSNHKECNLPVPAPYYPTRLLDLDPGVHAGLRLIETEEVSIDAPYLTLSHCWGTNPIIQLLPANVEEFKASISIDQLPPTFREAVTFTRALGFRYLWIDSLCIIQGPDGDWNEQAPTMSEVYSRAFCNISATKSSNPTEGLFSLTRDKRPGPCLVPLLDNLGDVVDFVLAESDPWRYRINNAPLSHRAWVTQERILSRRVIHFCYDQIAWECACMRTIEEFPSGLPKQLTGYGTSKLSLPSDSDSDWQIEKAWQGFVKDFTKGNMRYSSDKLVAISGLAKRLPKPKSSRYLAGIWSDHLLEEMFWTPVNRPYQLASRASPYRAPTWSWASINGSIDWLTQESQREFVEIIDFDTVPVQADGFGQIADGMIRLCGKLVERTIHFGADGTVMPDVSRPDVIRLDMHETLLPQIDGHKPPIKVFLGLLRETAYKWGYQGLVLTPVPTKKGYYTRVGIFQAGEGKFLSYVLDNEIEFQSELYEDGYDGTPVYTIV